jgi:hypothetical protein
METPEPVTPEAQAAEAEPRPLPTRVDVANISDLSMTPNELRGLKVATGGRPMEALMGAAADDADRMQAIVWLELRRRGFSPSWDDAADVAISFAGAVLPDPTPTDTTPTSPGSADSGE